MQKLLSSLSHKSYKHIAKPIFFTQKPDIVHERLVAFGSSVQKIPVARNTTTKIWAYQNDAFLEQNILGIPFKNPVGLSAGFDKNFELPLLLKSIGFGFMEGGSITYKPCKGNPKPWFYRLPKSKSLVVHAGLANHGAPTVIKRIQKYPSKYLTSFPLNISVAKTNSKTTCKDSEAIADYIGSLRLINEAGVGSMITLNISCPNTYGGEPFTTPIKLNRLLVQVDKLDLKQPLFIKMPAELPWVDFEKLLEVAAKHKIAGVTISNLAKDRGQADLMDELPEHIKGNLSGKPTWGLSNELIKNTYKKYGDRFVIIGVGGIFSAEDAYTKIKLGASLVELITGMIFEGPQLIGQINEGLVKLLKKDGYANIHEAIGVDG